MEYFDKTTNSLFQSIASENGLFCYEIRKNDKSLKCDGLHGEVIGVQLMCKDKQNSKEVLVNVAVKRAFKSDALRSQIIINDIYSREALMYSVIFSAFQQFETDKNLMPTLFAPKFFKANLEDKSEILVLENLKENGYKMCSSKTAMDPKHVSLVLEKYARLHALGFALRDQNLEKFRKITNSMDDIFMKFVEKSGYIKGVKHISLTSLKCLQKDVDTQAYKIYKDHINNIENLFDDMKNAVSDDFSTVLHGDGWTSNIMFKHDDSEDPGKPTSVRFVDFQLARLGPPVLDVAFFFYICSQKETINELDDYLRIYYNSLAAHLIKLGSNADKIYPYSVFLLQWRKYSRFVLTLAISVTYLMLAKEEELVDLTDVSEANNCVGEALNDSEIANIDLYYDRARHIILHAVENKLI